VPATGDGSRGDGPCVEHRRNRLLAGEFKLTHYRTVALPSLAVDVLRRHRLAQFEQRAEAEEVWQDHDLVACMDDGRPWRPDEFTHAFINLLRKHDLPRVRLHDCRHSHATQLLKQGVHVKVVSERLGHSTVGFTLDTYSHVLPGMQEDAAARVDRALRAAMGG
jgi:integrase